MRLANDGLAGKLFVCPRCGVTLTVPPTSPLDRVR
jgi:hypothetical protein